MWVWLPSILLQSRKHGSFSFWDQQSTFIHSSVCTYLSAGTCITVLFNLNCSHGPFLFHDHQPKILEITLFSPTTTVEMDCTTFKDPHGTPQCLSFTRSLTHLYTIDSLLPCKAPPVQTGAPSASVSCPKTDWDGAGLEPPPLFSHSLLNSSSPSRADVLG